jgi:hypothetical protein
LACRSNRHCVYPAVLPTIRPFGRPRVVAGWFGRCGVHLNQMRRRVSRRGYRSGSGDPLVKLRVHATRAHATSFSYPKLSTQTRWKSISISLTTNPALSALRPLWAATWHQRASPPLIRILTGSAIPATERFDPIAWWSQPAWWSRL